MITTQTDLNRAQSNAPADPPSEPAPLPNLSDRDKRKLNDHLFVHQGDLTATARSWGCLEVEVIAYLGHPLITPYLAALARLKRAADCRAALDTLRETLAAPELTPAHAERRRAATAILRHHQERTPRTPRPPRQQTPPRNPPQSSPPANTSNRASDTSRQDNSTNQTASADPANTAHTATSAAHQTTSTAAQSPPRHQARASSFAAQSGDT